MQAILAEKKWVLKLLMIISGQHLTYEEYS